MILRTEAELRSTLQVLRPKLLAYINRHLGFRLRQRLDADDILQETVLDAMRRTSEWSRLQREPLGWLCQIAEHRLIDAHKRYFQTLKRAAHREVSISTSRNDDKSSLAEELTADDEGQSPADHAEQLHRLQTALQQLPADVQKLLTLRYMEGLTTRAIAEQFGKADGAIRVMLSRSVQKLQALLTDPK